MPYHFSLEFLYRITDNLAGHPCIAIVFPRDWEAIDLNVLKAPGISGFVDNKRYLFFELSSRVALLGMFSTFGLKKACFIDVIEVT